MSVQSWAPSSAVTAATAGMLGGLAVVDATAQDSASATRICLAPTDVEASSGSTTAAIDASREAFTAYLTGPSLRAEPLKSRLDSQVKEEAKQAGCPFLLLTTMKHVQKRSGGGWLGRAAAGAAQQGAWEAAWQVDRPRGGLPDRLPTARQARRPTTTPSPSMTRTS